MLNSWLCEKTLFSDDVVPAFHPRLTHFAALAFSTATVAMLHCRRLRVSDGFFGRVPVGLRAAIT